jgi:hypothetical protein
MLFTVFLVLALLVTGAVAVVAPPLLGAATVLALAWAAVGWTLDRRASRSV